MRDDFRAKVNEMYAEGWLEILHLLQAVCKLKKGGKC